MRKFKVKIDGEEYIVEVEEIGAENSQTQVVRREAPASRIVEPRREKNKKSPQVKTAGGGSGVKAPMPGKILEIKVEVGQQVQQGEILMVLEAMKLENNIIAPYAGKITEVKVEVGANIEAGDLLVNLE